jgi:hypothetical protein
MSGIKRKSGGKRKGAGRSAFEPTDEQRKIVDSLTAFGHNQSDICLFIKDASGKPISIATLKKHFANELKTGSVKANYTIETRLFEKAKNGETAAILFWLKCRAGWNEKQQVELTGKDGGPIAIHDPDDEARAIALAQRLEASAQSTEGAGAAA